MITDREMAAARMLEAFLKAGAPYDTGNLALNSIRIVERRGQIAVVIGGEIAPYATYTNEEWIAERWRGKVNPNQGWIEAAIQAALSAIQAVMSGAMTKAEYDNIMAEQGKRLLQTQQARLEELGVSEE